MYDWKKAFDKARFTAVSSQEQIIHQSAYDRCKKGERDGLTTFEGCHPASLVRESLEELDDFYAYLTIFEDKTSISSWRLRKMAADLRAETMRLVR